MQPEQHQTMIDLLFPEGEPGIILGHNGIPEMPQEGEELKSWFAKSSYNARHVLDAMVAAYDPTNPLAAISRAGKRVQEQIETMGPEQLAQAMAETASLEAQNQATLNQNGSEPSSQLSLDLIEGGTTAETSTSGIETPLSTDSPLPSTISENQEQPTPTEDTSPGGAEDSGSPKSTTVQESLELTSPVTSGGDEPQS
jgi:hypothetical protein